MSMPERTPMKIPLPCFGLEHNPLDSCCQSCPHEKDCIKFMGTRANKIPLDRLRFDLMPQDLKFTISGNADDRNARTLLRTVYTDCHRTIFKKDPDRLDEPDFYRDEIVSNAGAADCTLGMFILSNMFAHTIRERTLIEHNDKALACRFYAKLLAGEGAVKRAVQYKKLCKGLYATFSVYSLSVLSRENYESHSMKDTMLTSEVAAGQFLVQYHIDHAGDSLELLYAEKELNLDAYWLATESSYRILVLDPSLRSKTGSKELRDHRLEVIKAMARFRRRRTTLALAFQSRQEIMPQAVERVLCLFGMRPDDFLHEAVPIVDPLALWREIGTTLQHYNCWRLVQGYSPYSSGRAASRPSQDGQC